MAGADGSGPHVFEVRGEWSADERRGEIGLSGPQPAVITVPAAFGGTGRGTNPEELLLASALACYMMTASRTLARKGLGGLGVEPAIVGEVSRGPDGLHFDHIRLRPVIHGAGASPAERDAIVRALTEAEDACFIARTLRPTIPYTLEPRFAEG